MQHVVVRQCHNFTFLAKGESGVMVGLQAREIIATDLAVVSSRKRATDLEFYRMARMLAK